MANNEPRSDRAFSIMLIYKQRLHYTEPLQQDKMGELIIELLTDLRHLAPLYGGDFNDLVKRSDPNPVEDSAYDSVLQKAIELLMSHADEDFVSKADALEAGKNLHNLMIKIRRETAPYKVYEGKLFACIWGDYELGQNSYRPNIELNEASFFSEDLGYELEDIEYINDMGLGEQYTPSYRNHLVIRIQ